MPKLLLEVPDTDASTARPITLEIIRQVMKATGIDKNTTILFPNEEEEEAQLGSRLNDDGEKNKFTSTNKVIVDVEEEYSQDKILATAVYYPENNYVFLDNDLSTYIKPVYGSTEVTINFRYRARDKVLARRWRDDIKNRTAMMRDVNVHDVDYHYLLPPEFIFILQEIHRLRELQAGYGDVFDDYLKNNSTQRLTLLTNLAGSKDAWAISETQQRIQGWFDFEGVPEQGSKDNDTNSWTISFAYKFRYDKPLACAMSYPLMIHNQTLSKKFRDSKTPYELEDTQRSYSLSMFNLSFFEKNPIYNPNLLTTGIGIPEVDDFVPSQVIPTTIRVLTALVKLTETDKRTLLDLQALGKYQLNEIVMDFLLESEYPFVSKTYGSILQVSVYRNVNIVPDRFVSVNNAGVVSVIDDLSLRDFHHVRLSLVSDLSLLTNDAIERLREHGCAFKHILAVIEPRLLEEGLLPESMCKSNYVTREQLGKVMKYLERTRLTKGNRQAYQFNTVMNLFVTSDRNKHVSVS